MDSLNPNKQSKISDSDLTSKFAAHWGKACAPKRNKPMDNFTSRFSAHWGFITRFGQLGFNWDDDDSQPAAAPSAKPPTKTAPLGKTTQRSLFDEPDEAPGKSPGKSPTPSSKPAGYAPAPREYTPAPLTAPEPIKPQTTAAPLQGPPANPASTTQRQPSVPAQPKEDSALTDWRKRKGQPREDFALQADPVLPPLEPGQKTRQLTPELREQLAERYRGMARTVAKKYARDSSDMWDLMQQANIGLWRAAETYSDQKGASFGTHAYKWMQSKVSWYAEKTNRERGIGGDEPLPESKGKARPEGPHVREITRQDLLDKGFSVLNKTENEIIRRLFGYHRDKQSVTELAQEFQIPATQIYEIKNHAVAKMREVMKFSAAQLMEILRFASPVEDIEPNDRTAEIPAPGAIDPKKPKTNPTAPVEAGGRAAKPGSQNLNTGAMGASSATEPAKPAKAAKPAEPVKPAKPAEAAAPASLFDDDDDDDDGDLIGYYAELEAKADGKWDDKDDRFWADDPDDESPNRSEPAPVEGEGAEGAKKKDSGVEFLGDVKNTAPADPGVEFLGDVQKTTPDSVKGKPAVAGRKTETTPPAGKRLSRADFTLGQSQVRNVLQANNKDLKSSAAQLFASIKKASEGHDLYLVQVKPEPGQKPQIVRVNGNLHDRTGKPWNLDVINNGQFRLEAHPRVTPAAAAPNPDLLDATQKAKQETQNTSDNPGSNDLTQIRPSKPNQQKLEDNLSIAGRDPAGDGETGEKPSWFQGVGEGLKRALGLGGSSPQQQDVPADGDEESGQDDLNVSSQDIEALGGKDFFNNPQKLLDQTSYRALRKKQLVADRREDADIRKKNDRRNQLIRLAALGMKHQGLGRRMMNMWIQYNNQQTQQKLDELREKRIPRDVRLSRKYQKDREILKALMAQGVDTGNAVVGEGEREPIGPPYYGLPAHEIQSALEMGIGEEAISQIGLQQAIKDGLWDGEKNEPTALGLEGKPAGPQPIKGKSSAGTRTPAAVTAGTRSPAAVSAGTRSAAPAGAPASAPRVQTAEAPATEASSPGAFDIWAPSKRKQEAQAPAAPETPAAVESARPAAKNEPWLPKDPKEPLELDGPRRPEGPDYVGYDPVLGKDDNDEPLIPTEAAGMLNQFNTIWENYNKTTDESQRKILLQKMAAIARKRQLAGYVTNVPGTQDRAPTTIQGFTEYAQNAQQQRESNELVQQYLDLKNKSKANPEDQNLLAGLANLERVMASKGIDPSEKEAELNADKLSGMLESYIEAYNDASDEGKRGDWEINNRIVRQDREKTQKANNTLRKIINDATDMGVDFNQYLIDHGYKKKAFDRVPSTEAEIAEYENLGVAYKELENEKAAIGQKLKDWRNETNAHPAALENELSTVRREQQKILDDLRSKGYERDRFLYSIGLEGVHPKRPAPEDSKHPKPSQPVEPASEAAGTPEIDPSTPRGRGQQKRMATDKAAGDLPMSHPPSHSEEIREEAKAIRDKMVETLESQRSVSRRYTFGGQDGELTFESDLHKDLFYLGHYLANRAKNPKFNEYFKNPQKLMYRFRDAGMTADQIKDYSVQVYQLARRKIKESASEGDTNPKLSMPSLEILPLNRREKTVPHYGQTMDEITEIRRTGQPMTSFTAGDRKGTVSFESKNHRSLFYQGKKLVAEGREPSDSQERNAIQIYRDGVKQVSGAEDGQHVSMRIRELPREGAKIRNFRIGRGENARSGTLSFENDLHHQLFRFGAYLKGQFGGAKRQSNFDLQSATNLLNRQLDLTPNQIMEMAIRTYDQAQAESREVPTGSHWNLTMPSIPPKALVPVRKDSDARENYRTQENQIWNKWFLGGSTEEGAKIRDQELNELSYKYFEEATNRINAETAPPLATAEDGSTPVNEEELQNFNEVAGYREFNAELEDRYDDMENAFSDDDPVGDDGPIDDEDLSPGSYNTDEDFMARDEQGEAPLSEEELAAFEEWLASPENQTDPNQAEEKPIDEDDFPGFEDLSDEDFMARDEQGEAPVDEDELASFEGQPSNPEAGPSQDGPKEVTPEKARADIHAGRVVKHTFDNGLKLTTQLNNKGQVVPVTIHDGREIVHIVDEQGRGAWFYRSFLGTGGKNQGRWYPFGGLLTSEDGGKNWLIKGDPEGDKGFGRPDLAKLEDRVNEVLPSSDTEVDKFLESLGFKELKVENTKPPSYTMPKSTAGVASANFSEEEKARGLNLWKKNYLNKVWGPRPETPVDEDELAGFGNQTAPAQAEENPDQTADDLDDEQPWGWPDEEAGQATEASADPVPDEAPEDPTDSAPDEDPEDFTLPQPHPSRPQLKDNSPVTKAIEAALGTRDKEIHDEIKKVMMDSSLMGTDFTREAQKILNAYLFNVKSLRGQARGKAFKENDVTKIKGLDESLSAIEGDPGAEAIVMAAAGNQANSLDDGIKHLLETPIDRSKELNTIPQKVRHAIQQFQDAVLRDRSLNSWLKFMLEMPAEGHPDRQNYLDKAEADDKGISVEQLLDDRAKNQSDEISFSAPRGATQFELNTFTQRFAAHWHQLRI